jgi:Fe-S-cluster containining protein
MEDELEAEDSEALLNEWLDAMIEVYEAILEEWIDGKIVQPNAQDDRGVEFGCNNCGKCCQFQDHWVWVYPTDIKRWRENLPKNDQIVAFLGLLFPVEDNEGNFGYGLPSQQMLAEKFAEILKSMKPKSEEAVTLQALLSIVKKINPNFDPKSEYCIYYNPNDPNHCLIYPDRPIQCHTYPYDYPQFTKIVIPPQLGDRYGAIDTNMDDVPECPPDAFTGPIKQGVKITEDQRVLVTQEKANYLMSCVTQDWQETDISDLLLELYHRQIIALDRPTIDRLVTEEKTPQKFVAGARPTKPGAHPSPHKKSNSRQNHSPKKSSNHAGKPPQHKDKSTKSNGGK